MSRSIPPCFCWTRIGADSGERLDKIIARKERERAADGGVFVWGIGNCVSPSITSLIEHERQRGRVPEVIFSPMLSRTNPRDLDPTAVRVWRVGVALDGSEYRVPEHSRVRGRYTPGRPYYALVCKSVEPLLAMRETQMILLGQPRNLLSSRPVGGSQVTAVVRYDEEVKTGTRYEIAMRAELVSPHFVTFPMPEAVATTDA